MSKKDIPDSGLSGDDEISDADLDAMMARSFAEMGGEPDEDQLEPGSAVQGTVVAIRDEGIYHRGALYSETVDVCLATREERRQIHVFKFVDFP